MGWQVRFMLQSTWRFRALDTLREAAIQGGASFVGVTAAIFCCSQKFCFVAPGRIAP
jgi:hypothetical protein